MITSGLAGMRVEAWMQKDVPWGPRAVVTATDSVNGDEEVEGAEEDEEEVEGAEEDEEEVEGAEKDEEEVEGAEEDEEGGRRAATVVAWAVARPATSPPSSFSLAPSPPEGMGSLGAFCGICVARGVARCLRRHNEGLINDVAATDVRMVFRRKHVGPGIAPPQWESKNGRETAPVSNDLTGI